MNTIRLSGYKASPASLRFGTVDSYGVEQMQFVLSDDWKNLAITATFTNPQEKSTTVHVPADTLLIDVPPEATAGESGAGQIAVVGYTDGVQVISTKIVYTLQEHAPIEGSIPAELTPSLLQQVLTAIGNAETSAAAAKDAAEQAKRSASAAAASAAAATSVVKPFADMAVNVAKEAVSAKDAAKESETKAVASATAAENSNTAAKNSANAAAANSKSASDTAGSIKDSLDQIAENKAGVSQLKEDIGDFEIGSYNTENDITNIGNSISGKDLALNLVSGNVTGISGRNGYFIFDVKKGEKYSIDGISEHSSDINYPKVALAFSLDGTTLIRQEDGNYSYDLGIDRVDNVYGYVVEVPNGATKMHVSNRGGAKVRKLGKTTNPLVNKKLGILGDSIAYGYGSQGGFGKIIADNNNMTMQNVAVSGACISVGMKKSDQTSIPCIYDQVALLDSDCDIVVFDGCFNDRGVIEDGRTTLGTITSIGWYGTNEPDSFCHCFENLLEALVQKFHGKPILYVYHHPIQKAKDTVHDLVIQMLEKWSIPYVDLSNASGGMITQIGTINNIYTVGDTVHPNKLGYKTYYVPQITEKMKTLIVR